MPDLDKSPVRIASMFDAIARRYDLLNTVLSAGLDRAWRRRAIRALELTGRELLLDVCTGTADVALAALRHRPGAGRVVGVDLAGAMLQRGRLKAAQARLQSRSRFVRADAMHLPLADESVDGATMAFGIRNVEQPAAACAELHRVLRAGGRVAILEFGLPVVPGVRQFYLWYFRHVLPRVGRVVSGHAAAYSYLPQSVGAFPCGDEFAAILRAAGFRGVEARPMTFGIVYLYSARKPEPA